MTHEFRVVTTDLNVVKVVRVANEADELALPCAAVDSNGNFYVWGNLKHFLPYCNSVITQCFDDNISDEDLLASAKDLVSFTW
jgi:hypothetical protein